jgi:hypothetical protein
MTQFKKGESGNPDGRPKGSKSKGMAPSEIQEKLSRGTKTALNTVLALMKDKEGPSAVRLRAALEWMGMDIKYRKAIEESLLAELEVRETLRQKGVKQSQPEEKQNKEGNLTPIVSLKSVK